MTDLAEQLRGDALGVACEYCDAAIGERCVDPRSGMPIERQIAHHLRLVAAGVTPPPPVGERCGCCGLPPHSCERARKRAALLEQGWISARFPSCCERCRRPFRAGSMIRQVASGWRADCCAGAE